MKSTRSTSCNLNAMIEEKVVVLKAWISNFQKCTALFLTHLSLYDSHQNIDLNTNKHQTRLRIHGLFSMCVEVSRLRTHEHIQQICIPHSPKKQRCICIEIFFFFEFVLESQKETARYTNTWSFWELDMNRFLFDSIPNIVEKMIHNEFNRMTIFCNDSGVMCLIHLT